MMSLINHETDYKFSDICKSDDKWVHDGNWVSHPITPHERAADCVRVIIPRFLTL